MSSSVANAPSASPPGLANRLKRRLTLRLAFNSVIGLLPVALFLIWIWQSRAQLLTVQWAFNWAALAASFLVYSLALMVAVWAWGRLMTSLGGRTSWALHVKAYCQTNAARRIPFFPWHIIGRAIIYEAQGVPKITTTLAGVLELLLMTAAGLLYALLSLPFMINLGPLTMAALVLALVILFLGMQSSVVRWVLKFLRKPSYPFKLTAIQLSFYILTYVIIWFLGGLVLFLSGAFAMPLASGLLFWIVVSWTASGAITALLNLSPLSLGIREITLAYLLSQVMPLPEALVLALISRMLLTIYEICWSAIVSLVWR